MMVLTRPAKSVLASTAILRYKLVICEHVNYYKSRLRIVSNFGDRLSGGRNTRARAKFRGDATRGVWRSPRVASSRNFARARVCISPAAQSPSPKLETTRSLLQIARCRVLTSPQPMLTELKGRAYDNSNAVDVSARSLTESNNWLLVRQ